MATNVNSYDKAAEHGGDAFSTRAAQISDKTNLREGERVIFKTNINNNKRLIEHE